MENGGFGIEIDYNAGKQNWVRELDILHENVMGKTVLRRYNSKNKAKGNCPLREISKSARTSKEV